MQYFQEEQSDSDYEYNEDHRHTEGNGLQRRLFDEEDQDDLNGDVKQYLGQVEESKNGDSSIALHKKPSIPLREVVSDTEEESSNT